MLPILPVAKIAVSFVASAGVNKIASQIIKNNVVVITTMDKILIGAGSLAVTSMVMEATTGHIDRMIKAAREYRQEQEEEKEDTTEEE